MIRTGIKITETFYINIGRAHMDTASLQYTNEPLKENFKTEFLTKNILKSHHCAVVWAA